MYKQSSKTALHRYVWLVLWKDSCIISHFTALL